MGISWARHSHSVFTQHLLQTRAYSRLQVGWDPTNTPIPCIRPCESLTKFTQAQIPGSDSVQSLSHLTRPIFTYLALLRDLQLL